MRLLIVDRGSVLFLSCDTSIEMGTIMTTSIRVTPIPMKMALFFLVAAEGAMLDSPIWK